MYMAAENFTKNKCKTSVPVPNRSEINLFTFLAHYLSISKCCFTQSIHCMYSQIKRKTILTL